MEQSPLYDVGELTEFTSHRNANAYLEAGWILVSTHTWDYGHPVNKHQRTVYCLGWPRSKGPAVHPETNPHLEKSLA